MHTPATLAIAASLVAGAAQAGPVELSTFRALPRPPPTAQIAYGPAASQGIDVFVPEGDGPHPVAILVHGGCWTAKTAGREQMRHLGADLAARGIAAWSIGYRRADEPGGGYPGSFRDVSAAIDRIRQAAPTYHLDLTRTVLVGHSAGGHLSLWAAARDKAGETSPFIPGSVISLGGVGDLQNFRRFIPLLCGPGVLESLVPRGAETETSPAARPAPAVPVTLISSELDRLVPPYVAYDYALAMRERQAAPITLVTIPDAGHFDLVTTAAPAWIEVRRRIEDALDRPASATAIAIAR